MSSLIYFFDSQMHCLASGIIVWPGLRAWRWGTVDLEGIHRLDISRGSLAEHREHVKEVVKAHVSTVVLGKHLAYSSPKRVLLVRVVTKDHKT